MLFMYYLLISSNYRDIITVLIVQTINVSNTFHLRIENLENTGHRVRNNEKDHDIQKECNIEFHFSSKPMLWVLAESCKWSQLIRVTASDMEIIDFKTMKFRCLGHLGQTTRKRQCVCFVLEMYWSIFFKMTKYVGNALKQPKYLLQSSGFGLATSTHFFSHNVLNLSESFF